MDAAVAACALLACVLVLPHHPFCVATESSCLSTIVGWLWRALDVVLLPAPSGCAVCCALQHVVLHFAAYNM
jgi:hypothetical protein